MRGFKHTFTSSPQAELFSDRLAAGLALSSDLKKHGYDKNAIVLGLARGGVPVAYCIAKELDLPLGVLVVRKLGVPRKRELAFGAIAPDGIQVLNQDIVRGERLTEHDMLIVEREERENLGAKEQKYLANLTEISVDGKTVILVDDGLATGATMRAALVWAKKKGATRSIVAVPVASKTTCGELMEEHLSDKCICHITPEPFYAVGSWYEDFSQVSDKTVMEFIVKRKEEIEKKLINKEE